ncbi:hypothetical protein HDE_13472 [Halotydeus destructor]|nr:hypothetical protein HDE_13472 [Halotydeus destructor]
MKLLLVALAAILVASCLAQRPRQRWSRQPNQGGLSMAYIMAAGADQVVGNVQEAFSCKGLDYGYYADQGNNCQVYHICVPPYQQFTFFCNNGTIFDQKLMTCVREEQATPCGQSAKFYALNQNFGQRDNARLIYANDLN